MRVAPSASTQHSVCFSQFASSRSGKSSRACAPRLSLRFAAEYDRRHRLQQQVVELQRLDQVGVPDQAAVGDAARRRTTAKVCASLLARPRCSDSPVRNTAASLCMVRCISRRICRGRARALGVAQPVEARTAQVAGIRRQRPMRRARLHDRRRSGAPPRGRTPPGRAANWSRGGWRRAPTRRPPRRPPSGPAPRHRDCRPRSVTTSPW